MNKKGWIYYINSFYLIFVILWPLFQTEFFDGIDGAGRIVIAINVLALLANARNLSKLPKIFLLYLFWIIYAILNTYSKGFALTDITFSNWAVRCVICPYIAMIVAYFQFCNYFEKTVKLLFVILLIFGTIGSCCLKISYDEYDAESRFRNGLGNDFSNTMYVLSVFAAILLGWKKLKLRYFLAIIIAMSAVLALTATRKAFGSMVIVLIFTIIAVASHGGWKRVLRLVFGVVILYFAVIYIFGHSTMGERQNFALENAQFSNWFLIAMGDRAIQYTEGWDVFLNNLWTGVGLMKFTELNTFHDGLPLHSEYMVQLTECGIIGSALFLLFYYIIIKRSIVSLHFYKDRTTQYIVLGALASVVFINFTAWTYSNYIFHIIYGMVIAYYCIANFQKD